MAPRKHLQGCPNAEIARGCDADAKRGARGNYGPLEEDDMLDAYELMVMNAPDIRDFEPCEQPCLDPDCPCRYRPADKDP